MKKRLISTLLVLCITLSLLPAQALAANSPSSGTCGDNLVWTLDAEGTLTISGTGSMYNYSYSDNPSPWNDMLVSINKARISNGVTSIGEGAFEYCFNLTSVIIPETVTSIGSDAFDSCRRLTNISIPETVTSIGSCAFRNCEALANVNLPPNITCIESQAFQGCKGLSSITIPYGITNVKDGAFVGCHGLTDITIPSSVSEIGSSAFSNCSSLSHVVFSGSDISLFYPFAGCDKLKTAGPIGSGCNFEFGWTDRIPDRSFGSSDLVSAIIPDNISLIDNYAFAGCKDLTNVTIPDSVTNIGVGAFSNCDSLTDVYYSGSKAQWDAITVNSNNAPLTSATIHCNSSGGGGGSEPSTTITALYPANGSTFDHASALGDKAFHITFDREVSNAGGNRPELDFSVGTLEVHKASDDSVVYQVTESPFTPGVSSDVSLYGSTSPFVAINITGITPELDYDTEYYVTMPAGFIKMEDGSGSPGIEKGDWNFATIAEAECVAPISKSGIFRFMSDIIDGDDMVYSYDYDETWFLNDSTEYQHGLVKMSIRAALAAYGTDGTNSSPKNIEALMQDLQFSNIQSEYPKPAADTIGSAISSKNIVSDAGEKFALIMVAVRGGGYFDEWGGNFKLGTGTEHTGFSEAADIVLSRIQEYIETYKYDLQANKKIWIVGYSRGAATANLVAKRLDDRKISGISSKDVYAFCFECPQNTTDTSRSNTKYNNIVSIVNPIDLVPKVAMSAWGYGRYGKTYYLPYKTGLVDFKYRHLKAAMKEQYENLLRPYHTDEIDADKFIPGSSADILLESDWLPDFLAHELVSQDVYYNVCQDLVMVLAVETFGVNSTIPKEKQAETLISGYLKFLGKDELSALGGEIVTALKDYLFESHYGELCLSWLDSLEGEFSYADPKYRILYINCPVDIKVYDSNTALVASIDNDVVAEIEDGIIAYIDFDGQKVIALPNDEEYTIEMTATDSGNVTYTATQYNMDSGMTEKVVSYYEVDVVEGDRLTGIAENLSTDSEANYPLYMNDSDDSLTPDITQSGNSVSQYNVTVLGFGNGTVTGGGDYVSGEFAKVMAAANARESFLGWYVDSSLVSIDAEYRFLVDRDVSITAKFTQNTSTPDVPIIPTPTYPTSSNTGENSSSTTRAITLPASKGGTVTVSPKSASKGATVTLTAKPDKGYELSSITVTDSKGNELELTDKGGGKYTFIMPASAVTVNAVFEKTEPAENIPADETYLFPFTDVRRTDWFCAAVEYVFNKDLMTGTAPYTFDPQGQMNRAMVWTVLGRMADADVDGSESPWYSKAQAWAMSNNVSDGTNPTNSISRQELMTMLWRYIGSPAATADLNKFSDSGSVADWADSAMQWAVSTGLIVGDNGRLNPTGDAKRCEVATIFMRFCESIAE